MQRRNLADPLTKPIGMKEFEDYKRKMGIRYSTDWLLFKWEFVGNSALNPIIWLVDIGSCKSK